MQINQIEFERELLKKLLPLDEYGKEESEGLEGLLFKAVMSWAFIYILNLDNNKFIKNNILSYILYEGSSYILLISLSKLIDSTAGVNSLRYSWNKKNLWQNMKYTNKEEGEFIHIQLQNPSNSSYLGYIKTIRDKAVVHNEYTIDKLDKEKIEHCLHFVIRSIFLLNSLIKETKISPSPHPLLPFESNKLGFDKLFNNEEILLIKKEWELCRKKINEWMKTPLNINHQN